MNRDSKLKPKMNTTAKIIITILALMLVISIAFNIFGKTNQGLTTPMYDGTIDSVRVTGNSTAIYLPSEIGNNLTDSISVVISLKK